MEIPGYKVESTLGQGGMATVYLAVQESLERRVALKVMNSSLTADASFCERFLKEGKIIAQLSSYSEIVTIFDIGCAGANYYMAMEYISGANLKQRISHHTDLDKPLTIIKQIAPLSTDEMLARFVPAAIIPDLRRKLLQSPSPVDPI